VEKFLSKYLANLRKAGSKGPYGRLPFIQVPRAINPVAVIFATTRTNSWKRRILNLRDLWNVIYAIPIHSPNEVEETLNQPFFLIRSNMTRLEQSTGRWLKKAGRPTGYRLILQSGLYASIRGVVHNSVGTPEAPRDTGVARIFRSRTKRRGSFLA
jgi:hypothetical protein